MSGLACAGAHVRSTVGTYSVLYSPGPSANTATGSRRGSATGTDLCVDVGAGIGSSRLEVDWGLHFYNGLDYSGYPADPGRPYGHDVAILLGLHLAVRGRILPWRIEGPDRPRWRLFAKARLGATAIVGVSHAEGVFPAEDAFEATGGPSVALGVVLAYPLSRSVEVNAEAGVGLYSWDAWPVDRLLLGELRLGVRLRF